jgi:phage shock protein A
MDQLHEQVARAWRRLVFEQFLARLVWCVFAALASAAIAVALPRLVAIHSLPDHWDAIWLIAASVIGLGVAAIWTYFARRTDLEAAIEVDRRFDLRERVASSLSLSADDQATDAGQALVNDAIRAVSRLDIASKFRLQLSRRAWLPLVPAAIAFALVIFVDPREAASNLDPNSAANTQAQIKNATESARKKLEEQHKLADKQGLKEAGDLFKQIEQGTKELTEKKDIDRTKAAVKLNDLAKQLEERREQLGGKEAIQKQLQSMKSMGAGAGEKVAQAIKDGDWKKATEEIGKLTKQLQEGKLDDKAKEELAKQLGEMKDKLEAAAEAHQQAADDLKKQIEQQKRDGNLTKAGELQQKLDDMQKQQPQMDRLRQMARHLGQVQQGLQNGNSGQAASALSQMAQQMNEMEKEANSEAPILDAAMNQLELAKDAMVCPNCQGKGCEFCQGGGKPIDGQNPNGRPGQGLGQGKGTGPRPEERNNTNLRDTQVHQNPGRGSAVFGGLVEGPNIKGQVEQSIKEEMASQAAEPADPLTIERLPRNQRDQAEQYFDALREGK